MKQKQFTPGKPREIYKSLKTGKYFALNDEGDRVELEIPIDPDISDYKKIGENNVFAIFALKKQTHNSKQQI